MLRKSNSRSSLFSNDRESKMQRADPSQICRETEHALDEAAKLLPHEQFAPLVFRLIKALIKRAETESAHSQSLFLSTISACVDKYGANVELTMRTILLEVLCELSSNMVEDVANKLEKVKHTIIHTPLEYLLAKVFLLELRFYLLQGDEATALRSLKKCMELNEVHLVQYLQESQQIRQEIIDHVILAHYQHFRIRKAKKPILALESLSKAASAARKSYGAENGLVRSLENLQSQQEHLISNLDKYSTKSRAITEIVEIEGKKHLKTSAFYSWEDQRIVAQLLKVRDGERQVLHETSYEIKLDVSKIKLLKNSDWINVANGQISINEDELLRLLGVNLSQPAKEMTTRIEMRNLSRDLIIKKEEPSSSDDSENLFEREEFKFFKHRTPSRAHSTKKFKQTQ